MPYATIAELPERIRRHLPAHAQEIYRAAFNAAFQRYGPANEGRLARIAWAAVKRQYMQLAGLWVRRVLRARPNNELRRARGSAARSGKA